MTRIHITTFIAAPPERVFDLSRSVDLHRASMKSYRESVVNGTMNGLLKKGDTVTWKAKHLFKERLLKTQITALQPFESFTDEQVEGDFLFMKHEHFFRPVENGTFMIDYFDYEVPYGILGKWLNGLYLKNYLTRLLEQRNQFIKTTAETDRWKPYLLT
jgi:ligand-binding SRPBCC domain-containing protein